MLVKIGAEKRSGSEEPIRKAPELFAKQGQIYIQVGM